MAFTSSAIRATEDSRAEKDPNLTRVLRGVLWWWGSVNISSFLTRIRWSQPPVCHLPDAVPAQSHPHTKVVPEVCHDMAWEGPGCRPLLIQAETTRSWPCVMGGGGGEPPHRGEDVAAELGGRPQW